MSETIEAENVETLTITKPTDAQLTDPAMRLLRQVEAMEVDSDVMYGCAADELRSIKRRTDALDDQRRAITVPLDQAKTGIMDLYRKPLAFLKQAELVIKQKMLVYTQQRERERQAEQARLEALARKEREKLEQQATKAAESGKAEKAEVLRDAAASIPVSVILPAAVPKIAGQSVVKRYRAEVTNMLELVQYVAANPQFIGLLEPDMPALNAQARSLKMAMQLPGVRVVEDQGIASRTS